MKFEPAFDWLLRAFSQHAIKHHAWGRAAPSRSPQITDNALVMQTRSLAMELSRVALVTQNSLQQRLRANFRSHIISTDATKCVFGDFIAKTPPSYTCQGRVAIILSECNFVTGNRYDFLTWFDRKRDRVGPAHQIMFVSRKGCCDPSKSQFFVTRFKQYVGR